MFFNQVGKMALGSRLRILSERMTEDAQLIYQLYQVDLRPKWFPVFYVLSAGQENTITAIATAIGHSHPSVSKIVREMVAGDIVVERKDESDGRKNRLELTPKGRGIAARIQDQYLDVNRAVEEALAQTHHNLWKALEEFEFLLSERSLLRRVQQQKKERESKKVKIVPYEPRYREAFYSLNEEWINTYFKMEKEDLETLGNPKEYILDNGGHILVALYENEPVGVCALIKMKNTGYDFELAKMAVTSRAKGKGIGSLLGRAIVEKARSLGAKKIYLESNTQLTPAINLYQKLGFKKVVGPPSPYERCNIQMELELDNPTR